MGLIGTLQPQNGRTRCSAAAKRDGDIIPLSRTWSDWLHHHMEGLVSLIDLAEFKLGHITLSVFMEKQYRVKQSFDKRSLCFILSQRGAKQTLFSFVDVQ